MERELEGVFLRVCFIHGRSIYLVISPFEAESKKIREKMFCFQPLFVWTLNLVSICECAGVWIIEFTSLTPFQSLVWYQTDV